MIDGPEGGCLVTVLQVRGGEVSLLISHTPAAGQLNSWTVTLQMDKTVKVGPTAKVTVVDVREEKARLGIVASAKTSVHRLEVYEAIKRENRAAAEISKKRQQNNDDAEDGPAGSPVPRPSGPKPPTLDAQLREPPAADGGGE
jgi:carbon storage regulator CsrA